MTFRFETIDCRSQKYNCYGIWVTVIHGLIISRYMDDYPPTVCHSACRGTPCRLLAKGITSRPVYNTMPRIHFFPTSAAKAARQQVPLAHQMRTCG